MASSDKKAPLMRGFFIEVFLLGIQIGSTALWSASPIAST
jgi:hypothetical protein